MTDFIPTVPPIYQTQLAFDLNPTDMVATITPEDLITGDPLPDGTLICFSVDIGQPNPEYIIGTLTGETLTITLRNVDPLDPTVSIGAFTSVHGQGAVVKITDFATIQIMRNILSGEQAILNPLISTNPAVLPTDVPNYSQLTSAVISGGVPASTTQMGITRLAKNISDALGNPTITIASPAVIILTSHGLTANDIVVFTTSGTLPTGITAGVSYYVLSTGLTANAFEISATAGGTAINTSGSQSGTHTLTRVTPMALSGNSNTNDALVGDNTDITPSTGNKFVTQTGLQHNAEKYAADAGSTDTYVITLSPVPTSYTNGMIVYFKANTINTGAATLNVNSLGAITIVKYVNTTLIDGDIAAGQFCTVIYNGTNFVLQNPTSNLTPNIISAYTINADETVNSYTTHEIPINGITTTIYGWSTVTTTLGASSSISAGGFIQLSGSTSSDFTMITALPGSTLAEPQYNYGDTKIMRIKVRLLFSDSTDRKGFGLVLNAANIHTPQTDTTNGEIRFVLNGATLYAQNANGTATSTDITSSYNAGAWNIYEIILTPGVNIKYYINGILIATHTTNIPTTGGAPYLAYGNNANGRIIYTTCPIVSIQN